MHLLILFSASGGIALAVAVSYILIIDHQLHVNLQKARQHIPLIRAKIASDPRFINIQFSDYTADNGLTLNSVFKQAGLK